MAARWAMRETVRVQAGEFVATDRDLALVTVLGSCVAACIRDRDSGIGGMNHFMLPRSGGDCGPASATARYGVNAMELLINELIRLGERRANLEAKVFGGGNILPGITRVNVGEMNATFVRDFLREESIPLLAQDLQGTVSRKVEFLPASGHARVRDIGGRVATVLESEMRYVARVHGLAPGGAVEIF